MAELETAVETAVETEPEAVDVTTTENVEIARLKAELAKQKAAMDKATKEASDYKKQLRAKQSEEEVAAEEKRLADEERDRKLAEYEKRFTVAETCKKVMGFINDETTANTVAEYLYGAADVDAAIAAISKAWTAKEKTLRLEYGKIPAPAIGSDGGSTVTKTQLDAMSYTERLEFAKTYPEDYNRLMGR